MKVRKNISLFFVYVAMACLFAHAFVPHCHCADGRTMLLNDMDECHLESCEHHHCEDCGEEPHFCHNHHAHEHDDDCVLSKPFVKSADVSSKIHVPSCWLLNWMLSDNILQSSLNAPESLRLDRPPVEQQFFHSVELTACDGLRAPPIC